MDETTHAFSPKVLDRAFTIEFNEVDLGDYPAAAPALLDEATKERLQRALLRGFQREGSFAQVEKAEIAEYVQGDEWEHRYHLQFLNEDLFQFELHFGYRVFDEIAQFMVIASRGDLFDDLDKAFDTAVLMKVLPKFNGPRSRLRRPLETVIAWARSPDAPDDGHSGLNLRDADACRSLLTKLPAEFVYPETARKAIRMLIHLHETGFASFA
jgi:5-methylcytosine-specific restriction endonuclease McrBC GTP-binding regulatory subunit McrB